MPTQDDASSAKPESSATAPTPGPPTGPKAPPRAIVPGDPKTLYVIDISGYVFRAYHAVPPLSNSKGEPTNATYGVTAMLMKLVLRYKPAYLAVAMDSKKPSFRKELYDGYKANRPPTPPDLSKQMERVREVVEAYAIPVLQCEGIEADDMIATVVKRARAAGLHVVIVSADKDLLQLVGPEVCMVDTMRDKVFGEAETLDKMGVPPSQVRDLLALMGDTSDNVPGVPSVGPKTAAQLLAEFGDLDGIYANLDKITRKALRATLETSRESAMLSRRLVTLKDDLDVDFDLEKLRYGGADKGVLRALFLDLEFNKLAADLGEQGSLGGGTSAASAPPKETERKTSLVCTKADLDALLAAARAQKCVYVLPINDGADVLAPRVGVAIAAGDTAAYIPFGHRYLDCPPQLDEGSVLAALGPVLEDASIAKISSDSKHDENVLARAGITLRGVSFDTMLASYLLAPEIHDHSLSDLVRSELQKEQPSREVLLGKQARGAPAPELATSPMEKIGQWAAEGVDLLATIAPRLEKRVADEGFKPLLMELELPLARVLAEMERAGILLDVGHLRSISTRAEAEMKELVKKCHDLVGHEFNVGSPRQLETILFDELKLPVVKKTKTARSTDHEVLEELAGLHDLPAAILEHRSLSKLVGTYLEALPKQVRAETGRVHTRFDQAVAATGRISSNDPNLQNIPIRTELGRSIRDAFIAPPGWEIVSADYSQIELRVLAHLSKDPLLVEAFTSDVDVHVGTAQALFGVSPAEVTRDMRGRAKTVNYAVIYGQTEFALSRNLRIDRKEAARYIEAFFARYAGVKAFLDEVVEQARSTGAVRTMLGRRRPIPDIQSSNRNLRMAAERVAKNTPIQGSAADLLKLAMLAIHRKLAAEKLRARMLLTVHDELVFEAPTDEVERLVVLAREGMSEAMKLDVPLVVDVGRGPTWGKAH